MQTVTLQNVRRCLGVAWSAHLVSFLLAAGTDKSHNTTVSPDNSSYIMDLANGTTNYTTPYQYEKEKDNIFTSNGFMNGMFGLFSLVVGLVIFTIKSHYRKKNARRQPAGANLAPLSPAANGGGPAPPQTWNLESGASSGLTSTTSQPSSVFSTTTSSSGIDYSNNNFLSNYSTLANYSSLNRL